MCALKGSLSCQCPYCELRQDVPCNSNTCCNLNNQYIVSEILAVARELKHSAYSKVYLSKDRTPEERERRKKCVVELNKMDNRGWSCN